MPERPNLLVFMSDQHSRRVLGAEGDPFVRTPNLDAFAARGVRFRRAYCGSPLCVPSRATFLATRHSSEIDVWTNHCIMNAGTPTFAHTLTAAGYETVLCGRMHFVGPDHRHGFEKHLVGDVTPQWPGSKGPDLGHIPGSTTGQTRPCVEIAGPGRTAYQAFERAVVSGAVEYLRRYAASKRERPFALVVGGVLPHCPFICPKDLFDEYYAKVDVPRLSEAALENLHPAIRLWREERGTVDIPDEQVRTARAAYYGLVTLLDGMLGDLFSALDETGLAPETAAFYTSDHGDMAGEHEMWWKSNCYESSVGVPLIASWPGQFAEGRVAEAPASLLDIGCTLNELGGAKQIPFASGTSLLPRLLPQGDPDGPQRDIFSENIGKRDGVPSRMVVRWPWKLVHFHGYERPQLFNVAEDPDEERDLSLDSRFAKVREELHGAAKQGWDGERVRRKAAEGVESWRALAEWCRAATPPDPDHWREPEGCNVFPEG